MTTLVDEGEALVVRCDACRRLWPVARSRLESAVWTLDEDADLHRCPVCTAPPADRGGAPGLPGRDARS